MSFDAIVVLGCRVLGPFELSGAASRRVSRAAEAYHEGLAPRVIASGGKRWNGTSEASAFEEVLVRLGVPRAQIVREEHSLSTVENARFVARLVKSEELSRLCVVTCDWHMARARAAFAREGLSVFPIPARAPAASLLRTGLRYARERLQQAADRVASGWERSI